MLCEKIQTQEVTRCMIRLYEISRKDKSRETESRLMVAWDWGWEWRVIANGPRTSFRSDDVNAPRLECGDGCTPLSIH